MQNDLLIDYAKEGQFSIADAAAALDYPLSTVYDHATSLVSSGVLKRLRVGKTYYYSLRRKPKPISFITIASNTADDQTYWQQAVEWPDGTLIEPPHTPSMDWGYKVFAAACIGLLAWAAIGGR